MFRFFALSLVFVLTACLPGSAPKGRTLPDCPGEVFQRQARVFDALTICATEGVSTAKLSYAANVVAEWLDNDSDGQIDEARLLPAFEQSAPFLIMTPSGPSNALFSAIEDAISTRVGQDLSAQETNPDGDRRDASQEEIHHLILNAGWKVAFPELFKDAKGSALYGQWEKAEARGHYNYDDPTCDSACKVTEFFYLATAAYLGSDADLASDEMRLKSRATLAEALPDTINLIESTAYAYPRDHWPTGTYEHADRIVFVPAEDTQ